MNLSSFSHHCHGLLRVCLAQVKKTGGCHELIYIVFIVFGIFLTVGQTIFSGLLARWNLFERKRENLGCRPANTYVLGGWKKAGIWPQHWRERESD